MIPADCDRAYLEKHYALTVKYVGKTLRTVDDKPQWVKVTRVRAECCKKFWTADIEILADKETPEILEAEVARYVDALKLTILKHEDSRDHKRLELC
jgi:hypothetical protein